MKFVKLMELEGKWERGEGSKGVYVFTPKAPILVNLDRVAYINPKGERREHSEITFLDMENTSCCVYVKESLEEIERMVRG